MSYCPDWHNCNCSEDCGNTTKPVEKETDPELDEDDIYYDPDTGLRLEDTF
jgi:hypothetical protein